MNRYLKQFVEPSYVKKAGPLAQSPYAPIEDRFFDPLFKVGSKKPYMGEIVTRALIWDYYRVQLALPNDSDILRKLGQNIEAVDELLCDARVKAAFNNRRAGVLSLKWTIDQCEAPVRVYKTVSKIFDTYPIPEIISEMMMAVFYGYNVTEVVWEHKDGLDLPTNLTGKAQRWFVYSDKNELRVKTKVEQVQGEQLPPRKFIVTRYHPRYDDPYAGREALFNAVYWPVKFRRILMQWAMSFLEKYGMPWFDISMEGGLQPDRLTEIVQTIQQTYQDGILAHPDHTKLTKIDMGDAKTIENYTAWLNTLNREIDMAILGNNLTTEIQAGSYAAAKALMGVREDIIKEDKNMIESSMNQLIEWIAWYNYPANIILPKFRLYKAEPANKERAEIDTMASQMGVRLNKEYYSRAYGYNQDEFELAVDSTAEGLITGVSDADAKAIQDLGIEAKDAVSNTQTTDAIIAQQKKGYRFAEKKGSMIFIRHGATDQNGGEDTDKIRGWMNVQLNEKGKSQAEKLGKDLTGKIDLLITSDLDRSADTANAIAKEASVPVIMSKALRPWDMGVYTGQHSKDVHSELGHFVDNPDEPITEGESFNSFRKRFLSKIQELKTQHADKRIALVSHHRNDRLLQAWDKAGNKDDLAIDKETFLSRGNLEPGEERKM